MERHPYRRLRNAVLYLAAPAVIVLTGFALSNTADTRQVPIYARIVLSLLFFLSILSVVIYIWRRNVYWPPWPLGIKVVLSGLHFAFGAGAAVASLFPLSIWWHWESAGLHSTAEPYTISVLSFGASGVLFQLAWITFAVDVLVHLWAGLAWASRTAAGDATGRGTDPQTAGGSAYGWPSSVERPKDAKRPSSHPVGGHFLSRADGDDDGVHNAAIPYHAARLYQLLLSPQASGSPTVDGSATVIRPQASGQGSAEANTYGPGSPLANRQPRGHPAPPVTPHTDDELYGHVERPVRPMPMHHRLFHTVRAAGRTVVVVLARVVSVAWRLIVPLPRPVAAFNLLLAAVLSATAFLLAARPPTVVKLGLRLSKLPASLDGYRIVQLSDLHLGPTVGAGHLQRAIELALEQKPNAVVLTGDLLDGPLELYKPMLEPLRGLVRSCSARAVESSHSDSPQAGQISPRPTELTQPLSHDTGCTAVLYVTGNHEYFEGSVPDKLAYLSGADLLDTGSAGASGIGSGPGIGVTVLTNQRVRLGWGGIANGTGVASDAATEGMDGTGAVAAETTDVSNVTSQPGPGQAWTSDDVVAADTIDVAGVPDWIEARKPGPWAPADLPSALAGRDTTRALLVLAHQPRAAPQALKLGADLILSGHTHGGQMVPIQVESWLRQPYFAGLYTITRDHDEAGTGGTVSGDGVTSRDVHGPTLGHRLSLRSSKADYMPVALQDRGQAVRASIRGGDQAYVSSQAVRGTDQAYVYVSRGAYWWGPQMRLGATQEITVITLKAERGGK